MYMPMFDNELYGELIARFSEHSQGEQIMVAAAFIAEALNRLTKALEEQTFVNPSSEPPR